MMEFMGWMSSRNSITVKFMLLVLLLPLGLTVVITIFSTWLMIRSENMAKKTLASSMSRSVLEKIDRNFYERFGDVQAFAYNILARQAVQNPKAPKRELQDFINTMTEYYVLYDLMMLCDKNGKVIACNTKDKNGYDIDVSSILGENYSTATWFTAAMESVSSGGAWYSDFTTNNDVSRISLSNPRGWGMEFVTPMLDSQSNFAGVWYNFAGWKEVTHQIRREAQAQMDSLYPGSFIMVTDADGVVIESDDSLQMQNKIMLSKAFWKAETSVTFDYKGKRYNTSGFIYSTSKASGAYTYKGKNWRAVTFIPASQFTFAILWSGYLRWMLLGSIFLLLLTTLLAVRFSKRITSKIIQVKDAILALSRGREYTVKIDSRDEVGQMAGAVNILSNNLRQTTHFAEEIGNGNLDIDHLTLGEEDVLGHALNKMKDNLKKGKALEELTTWKASSLNQLNDLITKHSGQSGSELYGRMLSYIVQTLKYDQGGLFVTHKNHGEGTTLKLEASYAYERSKQLQMSLEPGEGLVGQCYLTGEKITLTDIPTDYIRITSGLGEQLPRSITLLPIKNSQEVVGVLEVASFKVAAAHEIEFMERCCEIMAALILSRKTDGVTQSLLQKLQQQQESLRASEEELRQNMEELSSTQEELLKREQHYLQEIERLKNLN